MPTSNSVMAMTWKTKTNDMEIKINKTNQANQPAPVSVVGFNPWSNNLSHTIYADMYIWMVVRQILRGMKNVNFFFENYDTQDPVTKGKMDKLAKFINTNINVFLFAKWRKGYIIIDRDKLTGGYKIADYNKIRTDANGKVIGHDLVWYSDIYSFQRKGDFEVAKALFNDIDIIKNGDDYLTRNLGAFGILSGKGLPINAADKENFLNKIKKTIGISSDRMQFEVFTNNVEFEQVDFHLKDLDLPGKLITDIKALAAFFGVPYDLIPFSGQSTYANQKEAVQQLYANTIKPTAEEILELGRYIIKRDATMHIPSDYLTFEVQNVPELKDDRNTKIDYNIKVVDFLTKCKDLGIAVDQTQYVEQLNQPIE